MNTAHGLAAASPTRARGAAKRSLTSRPHPSPEKDFWAAIPKLERIPLGANWVRKKIKLIK